MLGHYSIYRGYSIGLEQKGSIRFITLSPKPANPPLYCMKALLKSEADDIAEAKSRVDKNLAS